MSWQEAKLGELADTQLGKMLDAKKNEGDFYPYLGNDNVQWAGVDLSEVKQMRFKASELPKFSLRKGDLLVCEGGDPGRCALWLSDGEMYYQKALHRVRVHESVLDNRFLYYYLTHIAKTLEIRQYYTGGATIKHLPKAALERVKVRYPDLKTQERIAGVLSAYDELIENNRRQIKLLAEAAQRLYKEWFVDLKFPGHETTPVNNGLPEGWKKCSIGSLSVLTTRGIAPVYADESEFLVLGQRCVRNHLVNIGFARRFEPKRGLDKWIQKGDILINSTGVGSLGRVAQVWFDPVGMTVDSHVTIVRAETPELASYLGQWAISNETYIESLHTGSTGQTELPRDRVSAIEIKRPPEKLLAAFSDLVSPLTTRIIYLQKSVSTAREACDRLLPKLMSGEIEV